MTVTASRSIPVKPSRTGPEVWDRLWRHSPDAERDALHLERERRSERWRLITRRLRERFGRIEGLKACELGSGRGDLSVLLAREGARVTLLDYTPLALEEARRRFEHLNLEANYVQADLLGDLSELEGRFDVAISIGVIEHFKGRDRTRALQAHRRVLNENGLVILSVPHARCPPYRVWKAWLEWRGWWPYGLEIPYTRGEMSRRAKEAGFTHVDHHTLGFTRSVNEHWRQGLLKRERNDDDRPSRWDRLLGSILLTFAHGRR